MRLPLPYRTANSFGLELRPWHADFPRRPMVTVFRRSRAAYLSFEWYDHAGTRWVDFGIASPHHHRWWAINVTVYFSIGK
jgi:hypothetical protein